MTSPRAAKSIIAGNFRPGHSGWCGGAIYMIDHPHLKRSKYNPHTTQTGAYVQAEVDLGKLCRMQRTCNNGASGKCCTYPATRGHSTWGAQNAGCNSIIWNPGDGDEYIIWHPDQVKSKKLYKCTKQRECQNLFPDLTFGQDGVVDYLGNVPSEAATAEKSVVGACPVNYPKCYTSGDCVAASCSTGCTTWHLASGPDVEPGEQYNWINGNGGKNVCVSDYKAVQQPSSKNGKCCFGLQGADCASANNCQGGWCGESETQCQHCNGHWCA